MDISPFVLSAHKKGRCSISNTGLFNNLVVIVRARIASACPGGRRSTASLVGIVEPRSLEFDAACGENAFGWFAAGGAGDLRVFGHAVLHLEGVAA